MISLLRTRALARALNLGFAIGVAGTSFEAHAFAMQEQEDKEAPAVEILSPKNGFEAPLGEPLMISVKATDNVIIKKVHLHMNGTDVGSIDGSADVVYRFQVKDIQKGEYTIKAVAYDLAGNSASSDEITVTGVEGKPKEEGEGDKEKDGGKSGSGDAGKEEGGSKSGDPGEGAESGSASKNSPKSGAESKEKAESGAGSKDEAGDGAKSKDADQDDKAASGKGSGEDKEDKGVASDESKSGKNASGKASSTQGKDEAPVGKGCNQGAKDLPWWGVLGVLLLAGAGRKSRADR